MELKIEIALTDRRTLDATDLRLLDLLQRDAGMSNHSLAKAAHTSPATCLRRVKRLRDAGLIEREPIQAEYRDGEAVAEP